MKFVFIHNEDSFISPSQKNEKKERKICQISVSHFTLAAMETDKYIRSSQW